jgi:hypothetical protein
MIKFFLDELDINKYLTLSQQQTLKISAILILKIRREKEREVGS